MLVHAEKTHLNADIVVKWATTKKSVKRGISSQLDDMLYFLDGCQIQ